MDLEVYSRTRDLTRYCQYRQVTWLQPSQLTWDLPYPHWRRRIGLGLQNTFVLYVVESGSQSDQNWRGAWYKDANAYTRKGTDSPFTLVLICYNTIYNFNFIMSLREKHKILYHILQFLILKLTSRFGRGSTVAACSSHSGQVASSRCKLQAISEILLHQPSFLW